MDASEAAGLPWPGGETLVTSRSSLLVSLVGPGGSGKTTLFQALRKVMLEDGRTDPPPDTVPENAHPGFRVPGVDGMIVHWPQGIMFVDDYHTFWDLARDVISPWYVPSLLVMVVATNTSSIGMQRLLHLLRTVGAEPTAVFVNTEKSAPQFAQEKLAALVARECPEFEHVPWYAGSAHAALEGDFSSQDQIRALADLLSQRLVPRSPASDAPFRMLLDDTLNVPQFGRGVAGRIESGTAAVGQAVELVSPEGRRVVEITALHRIREQVTRAEAGENVLVQLQPWDEALTRRGSWLAEPGTLRQVRHLQGFAAVYKEVELFHYYTMGSDSGLARRRHEYHMPEVQWSSGDAVELARSRRDMEGVIWFPAPRSRLVPGEWSEAQIALSKPAWIKPGHSFLMLNDRHIRGSFRVTSAEG